MKLTEKEMKILKQLRDYKTSYYDLPDEVGMTRRQAAGVLNSLRRKGLVEGGLLKYAPARDAVVWQLTEEGKRVFETPTPDDLHEAVRVGMRDELRELGISNPPEHLLEGSTHLVFVYRAILKMFPYFTIPSFHKLMKDAFFGFREGRTGWNKYNISFGRGLIISTIVDTTSVSYREFTEICNPPGWEAFRFLRMDKKEERG